MSPIIDDSRADRRQTTIGVADSHLNPSVPASSSSHPPNSNSHTSTTSMLKKQITYVFPMHLAPIDQFFCDDDTDKYPMSSLIHLDFTGQLRRKPFEAALEDALQRHALLNCHIRPAKRNLPSWVRSKERLPWIDYGSMEEPLQLPQQQERIDLADHTGLRFWVRGDDHKTQVSVQVHHAATDGTGVYRFLGDLLAGYAARTSDDRNADPGFAELEPKLLKARRRKMSEHAYLNYSNFRFITHGLKQVYNIFGKSIEALQVPKNQTPSAKRHVDFPGIHTVQIDKAQHKKLRAIAGKFGATLNDLLMAEMFRTIVCWNDTCGKSTGNPWLRIMMPFDLRNQTDYAMPAANMTSYTFVTRRKADCVDMKKLISSVRDETLALKGQRAGTDFIDAIMLGSHAPSILKYLLRRERCIATTCLSNIGDPSKRFTADLPREGGKIVAGNLTLDEVSGVPPMRQHTHATLAVFSYLRKLTISVRCDPFLFTDEQSKAFVTMFRDGLLSHLAE